VKLGAIGQCICNYCIFVTPCLLGDEPSKERKCHVIVACTQVAKNSESSKQEPASSLGIRDKCQVHDEFQEFGAEYSTKFNSPKVDEAANFVVGGKQGIFIDHKMGTWIERYCVHLKSLRYFAASGHQTRQLDNPYNSRLAVRVAHQIYEPPHPYDIPMKGHVATFLNKDATSKNSKLRSTARRWTKSSLLKIPWRGPESEINSRTPSPGITTWETFRSTSGSPAKSLILYGQ
jgi:hypothetical protein